MPPEYCVGGLSDGIDEWLLHQFIQEMRYNITEKEMLKRTRICRVPMGSAK
jgi:hypothetical protein